LYSPPGKLSISEAKAEETLLDVVINPQNRGNLKMLSLNIFKKAEN
jgi:hypothetical protein